MEDKKTEDVGIQEDNTEVEQPHNDVESPLTDDATKVKFLPASNSQNGDPNVLVKPGKPVSYGLDKEALMTYVDDPFWVRLRWMIFIGFWLIWLSMLVASIVIVVLAPKCPPPPERDWWQKSPVYEIYVRSFKDSDGDGIGDLKGVESKLDYIKDLGVDAIWLSPIYKSPMVDFGYDVQDYNAIDSIFGTMEDFDSLMAAIKERDMKVIMDFIPNHSSKEHPWFIKSINGEAPYNDYYVWKNPKRGGVPNNWLSVEGTSAWTFNGKRQQYYFHQYLKDQPDFNLRNEAVVEKLMNIMRFWLDKGVHGFRIDAGTRLLEDPELKDEPLSNDPNVLKNQYDKLDHIYTKNHPDTFSLLAKFRELLDTYNRTDGLETIMFTKAEGSPDTTAQYFGTEAQPITHFTLTNALINNLQGDFEATDVNSTIKPLLDSLPANIGWPSWTLGNHDVSRVGSRFGEELIDIMNMIMLLLPGTPVTYYGEEIGMVDATGITFEETLDPVGRNAGRQRYMQKSRDPERTPMQWNNQTNAGFSEGKPWLPVNDNYETINVEFEENDPNSHLSIYKQLVKLRGAKACMFGDLAFPVVTNEIFSFSRIIKGSPGYCVLVNLGQNATTVDLSAGDGIPEEVTVHIPIDKGNKVKYSSSQVPIDAKSGMVLRFVPDLP